MHEDTQPTSSPAASELVKNFSDRLLQSYSRSESLDICASASPRDVLQGRRLQEFLARYRHYTGFARLAMTGIAHYLSEGTIVHFTDAGGRIVLASGEQVDGDLFEVGTSLNEASVGTTAVSLALRYKEPVAICGAEHFWPRLHDWSCFASPVVSYDNRLLGCVTISCPAAGYQGDKLAVSSLLARQIETLMSDSEAVERARARKGAVSPAPAANLLTGRQQAVLSLFARGLSYKEVGRRLGISPKTVEGHLNAICDKFELKTRRECISKAVELGLL